MDVKMAVLPHNNADVLKSQQGRLLSAITAVKTENQDAASSLPPLHSLMASLDAVQGARELENLGHTPQPAFAVDINSEQQEMDHYAKDAFSVELSN
ncbi:MAG: hypothetical protein E7203_07600 [Selenomonas ruminantium]|jgi:hypothetical protein|uniref:Uncharacterized protein n=1 Tax=Selenomonas ruminantium TaxID=971 RepID=A0A927WIC0_SELRU|nr:hypothetical protein [Selenomonas ruminantium]MBE6085296.1 hypothetical protein [Selenomonas ruminantium]